MKCLFGLLVLVFSLSAFAFPAGYETKEIYQVKTDLDVAEAALDVVEAQVGASTVVSGLEGVQMPKILVVNYNSDDDAANASESSAWAYSIPAKSIITKVECVTDVVASASGATFRLSGKCESAQDLMADQDLVVGSQSAATPFFGVPVIQTASTHVYTASGCTPEWAVHASDDIDASSSGTTALDMNCAVHYTQMD